MDMKAVRNRGAIRLGSVAAIVIVAAIAAWTLGAGSGSSNATAARARATPPAAAEMSALRNPSLARSHVPAIAQRMGADVAPGAGAVRELVSDFGAAHLTVYAWQRGASGSVCYVASDAGGGCFGAFREGFDMSFTDADGPGHGAPMLVWGPVSDNVASVAVAVGGQTYQAAIKNNVAVFALPSGSMTDSDVKAVTVTLRNGDTVPIRL